MIFTTLSAAVEAAHKTQYIPNAPDLISINYTEVTWAKIDGVELPMGKRDTKRAIEYLENDLWVDKHQGNVWNNELLYLTEKHLHTLPNLSPAVYRLVGDALRELPTDICVIHGGFMHENIFVNNQGIIVPFKWQGSIHGSPYFDLGKFLFSLVYDADRKQTRKHAQEGINYFTRLLEKNYIMCEVWNMCGLLMLQVPFLFDIGIKILKGARYGDLYNA